jgi:hypothetical protein
MFGQIRKVQEELWNDDAKLLNVEATALNQSFKSIIEREAKLKSVLHVLAEDEGQIVDFFFKKKAVLLNLILCYMYSI